MEDYRKNKLVEALILLKYLGFDKIDRRLSNNSPIDDLIEEIFLTPKEAVWVPQYNFDFDTLWHLVHRGLSTDRVKQFIKSFNNGIREKITNPTRKEISFEIIKHLKNPGGETNADHTPEYKTDSIDNAEAEFDF